MSAFEDIDEFIRDNFSTNKGPVGILVNFSSSSQPYNFDLNLLVYIIKQICCLGVKDIRIYEKVFKDNQRNTLPEEISRITKDFAVKLCHITSNLTKIKVPQYPQKTFEYIFVDSDFLDCRIKLVLANASIHHHHSAKFYFSCGEYLALSFSLNQNINWSNYKQQQAIRVLREELENIYQDYSKARPWENILGVLDARKTKITNEHIPFYSRTKDYGLIMDRNLSKIRDKLKTRHENNSILK